MGQHIKGNCGNAYLLQVHFTVCSFCSISLVQDQDLLPCLPGRYVPHKYCILANFLPSCNDYRWTQNRRQSQGLHLHLADTIFIIFEVLCVVFCISNFLVFFTLFFYFVALSLGSWCSCFSLVYSCVLGFIALAKCCLSFL